MIDGRAASVAHSAWGGYSAYRLRGTVTGAMIKRHLDRLIAGHGRGYLEVVDLTAVDTVLLNRDEIYAIVLRLRRLQQHGRLPGVWLIVGRDRVRRSVERLARIADRCAVPLFITDVATEAVGR